MGKVGFLPVCLTTFDMSCNTSGTGGENIASQQTPALRVAIKVPDTELCGQVILRRLLIAGIG